MQNLELGLDLIIEEARDNYQTSKELRIADFEDFDERVQALNGKK